MNQFLVKAKNDLKIGTMHNVHLYKNVSNKLKKKSTEGIWHSHEFLTENQ